MTAIFCLVADNAEMDVAVEVDHDMQK